MTRVRGVPFDPSSFDDPVAGPALRRLAVEDPDLLLAVEDVDVSLIEAALRMTVEERIARGTRSVSESEG